MPCMNSEQRHHNVAGKQGQGAFYPIDAIFELSAEDSIVPQSPYTAPPTRKKGILFLPGSGLHTVLHRGNALPHY